MAEEAAPAGQDPVKKPETGVENNATDAPAVAKTEADLDFEAQLKAKDAEIERITKVKDNYKRAALKAKGKLPDDEDEETDEEKMRRISKETYLETQEAAARAEREALIVKMAKELSETKLALKNRTQMAPAGGSAGPAEEKESTSSPFSPEQMADLKKRFPHWGPKEFDAAAKNMRG